MKSKEKEIISALTRDIIKTYDIKVPITDIKAVVEQLGGILAVDTPLNPLNIPFIVKRGDSFELHIYNQESLRPNIEALGHLFLKMGYQISEKLWNQYPDNYAYNPNKDSLKDTINNYRFALSFLMPEDEFRKHVEENINNRKISMRVLADYFHVPINDVEYRGNMLGMWNLDF